MGGVSKTQVVKYIRKGTQGAVLRGPQAWSDCITGYMFQAGGEGDKWQDVVLYNGNYYVCDVSHTKTTNNYPTSPAAVNSNLWQLGDNIDLVATKILMSTYALVENLGVAAIDMKDAGGNIIFQAKDGNVTCKKGTFENVTVNGSISYPFVTLADSDAIYFSGVGYLLDDNLNIICGGGETIILPTHYKYNGALVNIFNSRLPPYSKTDLLYPTTVKVQGGVPILSTTTYGSLGIDYEPPTEVEFIGCIYQFVCLEFPSYPSGTETRWVLLNNVK